MPLSSFAHSTPSCSACVRTATRQLYLGKEGGRDEERRGEGGEGGGGRERERGMDGLQKEEEGGRKGRDFEERRGGKEGGREDYR